MGAHVLHWHDDIAIRRALRRSIAESLINTTRAMDRIFFDRVSAFALSDMPAINVMAFPPELRDDEVKLTVSVTGVLAQPEGEQYVMDDCAICVDALVLEADEFDNEIAHAVNTVTVSGCPMICTLVDVLPSVLQFSADGAKPSVLIRRLVTATFIRSSY